MLRELRTVAVALVAFTVVLGVVYPLALTPFDGRRPDLGKDDSKCRGCFQSRPSATGYAADATFFNNRGPNQRALAKQLSGYVQAYLKRERPFTPGLSAGRIPADAVTTSASGVDPDISVANARIQANRVARVRGLTRARVLGLVDRHTHIGESVSVPELNRALAAG